MGPCLRRDDASCGAFAFNELLSIQFSNSQRQFVVEPSLRANGSRECAPDDRLREAIHGRNKKKDGLLRRYAPRNDGKPAYDFALATRCARAAHLIFRAIRGRRERRVPAAPAASCAKCSVAHEVVATGSPEHPAFPAQWF